VNQERKMIMQISELSAMKTWQSYEGQHRFYLYEGNAEVGKDESDAYDTKREAIARAKIHLQNAWDMGFRTFEVHVIDRKTTEFIHTETL